MRLISGIGMLCMLGAKAFALSGTVKDNEGAAIAGASVSFVSDASVRQTTNLNGEFAIAKPVSIQDPESPWAVGRNPARLGIRGDRLRFFLPSTVRSGAITFFGSDGGKRIELPLGSLEAGIHQIGMPKAAPGMYYLRIVLGSFSDVARLLHNGNGTFLMPAKPGDRNASAVVETASALRRAAAGALDTLLVEKSGFASVKAPVSSFDQTGMAIVMNPDSVIGSPLPPITDYSAPGPFKTVVEYNVGPNSAYAIVRPDPLGQNGFLHAPIIYGYGINGDIKYAMDFLKPLASHGFVIIGCNKLTGGPNSPANNTAMTNGLNWLLQQNGSAGSKYRGKLAVMSAVSMGYSVGGTAAVDIGGHETIKTVVSIHGHISKAVLHGTLLQTTGTKDNVGFPMQQQTFENSKVPTFLGTVTGADHGYPGKDGGVERPAILAWLRYRIYNDTGAKRFFYGNDCVLCKAPWEKPQRKNWDE